MIRDDLLATLLGTGPLVRPEAPYRLVELAGPDAGDFLQRLCTQDVLGLEAEGLLPAAFRREGIRTTFGAEVKVR